MSFLIASVIVFNYVAFKVPKKLSKNLLYSTALFSTVLGLITDIILDLRYDLYGYFQKGPQLIGILPDIGIFPSAGLIYINFYPLTKSILVQILYIVVWTSFCVGYEFLSIQSGYFYHNGWTYLYSTLTYPVLLLILRLHLHFCKKYIS